MGPFDWKENKSHLVINLYGKEVGLDQIGISTLSRQHMHVLLLFPVTHSMIDKNIPIIITIIMMVIILFKDKYNYCCYFYCYCYY